MIFNLPSNGIGNHRKPVDAKGNPIVWPSTQWGMPAKAEDAPFFNTAKPEELEKAVVYGEAEFALLELPKDQERYTEILNWITDGLGAIRWEEKRWHPEKSEILQVAICWVMLYSKMPRGR